MLYYLHELADIHILFNLFQYVTVRSAGALVTALLVAFAMGPMVIRWLTRLRVGQVVGTRVPDPPHQGGHAHHGGPSSWPPSWCPPCSGPA